VNDATPSFVFSSSEPGTIAYEGGCSSSVAEAVAGMHAITLNHLNDGQYSTCKLRVTDAAGNFGILALGSFTVDTIALTITIATAIPLATNDNTPSFTIHLNEAGEASYSGACSSASTSVGIGDNTIVLNSLSDGNYSDCRLTVTDAAGNSAQIGLGSFTIDTISPNLVLTSAVPTKQTMSLQVYPSAPMRQERSAMLVLVQVVHLRLMRVVTRSRSIHSTMEAIVTASSQSQMQRAILPSLLWATSVLMQRLLR